MSHHNLVQKPVPILHAMKIPDGNAAVDKEWGKSKDKCSKGDSCSFKHDASKKGRGKGERERNRSPSPGSRPPRNKDGKGASTGKTPKGTSPSGEKEQPPCHSVPKRNLQGSIM